MVSSIRVILAGILATRVLVAADCATKRIGGVIEAVRLPRNLLFVPVERTGDAPVAVPLTPMGRFEVDLPTGVYVVSYHPPCLPVGALRIASADDSVRLLPAWSAGEPAQAPGSLSSMSVLTTGFRVPVDFGRTFGTPGFSSSNTFSSLNSPSSATWLNSWSLPTSPSWYGSSSYWRAVAGLAPYQGFPKSPIDTFPGFGSFPGLTSPKLPAPPPQSCLPGTKCSGGVFLSSHLACN